MNISACHMGSVWENLTTYLAKDLTAPYLTTYLAMALTSMNVATYLAMA